MTDARDTPRVSAQPSQRAVRVLTRPRTWRWRWRRFQRDCRQTASLGIWLPVVAATTVVSGLILITYAIQAERSRNELINRFAVEKLDFLASNLEVETRDWATWDDSYEHALGHYPAYYEDGYNINTFERNPFVVVLDRDGHPVSSARWDSKGNRIVPLSPPQLDELVDLVPQPHELRARTFMAMFGGEPYLISAQPVLNSKADAPAAGRLLFIRPLKNPDNEIARTALSLLRYQYEPSRPLQSAPLGPLAITIRNPRWDGIQPLQITVLRAANERINALLGFGLLLALNLLVLVVLLLQAYADRRSRRYHSHLQQRERERLERALDRSENSDELTGLLNEHGLLMAMERQRREEPASVRALLLIDIKHFALINNSFGREFGDRVLTSFSQWLKRHLEPGSLIARTAGDEFTCCLMGSSPALLRARINEITGTLQQLDLEVQERTLRLAVSAGARILTDISVEKALHETGVARDLAKISGRQQCQFYGDESSTMQSYIAIQRLNQELVASLKDDRIALFAQAAWRLDDSELPAVYVEFLSRIHDPAEGAEQPYRWSETLVEAATTCGTMPLLDSHVLALSFRLLRQLMQAHPDHAALRSMVFAINLTADTLLADDFVPTVESLVEREQLDPRRICFEITEQAAVRNLEVVKSAMQRLQRIGFRFSLDDFGAGMTSLSYLRDLPLDYLKIDKAFIWRVKGDPASRMTVEFAVRMGRELGFEVIAEGVEDLHLLYYLRDLGVTIAQGYVTAIPSLFEPDAGQLGFARSGRELLGDQLLLVA